METVETRVRRLEDRANLKDLVVRYFMATDVDNTAVVMSCFSEDATFAVSGQICGCGVDSIRAFLVSARSSMGLTIHVHNSTLIDLIDADTASGIVTAHLELVQNGVAVYGAVRYIDRYARLEGGWSIISRDMRVVYLAEWTEAHRALSSDNAVRWPGLEEARSDVPRPGSRPD